MDTIWGGWGTWAGEAEGLCSSATYDRRIDDPKSFNFCVVPRTGYDAFLFAGLAVLVTCAVHSGSLSAVLVLLAGALCEAFVFPFNLGRLGNAFSIFLSADPPELFYYAFLPPLLLDSALSIDFFLFKKVMPQVIVFAFLVVIGCAALLTPFLLYVLRLAHSGWKWQHGALFSAMLAPTDALAISALLKRAGGPEALVVLMEGESLLNDASGIVLFDLFATLVRQIAREGPGAADSPLSVIPGMAMEIARLALGGLLVGISMGYVAVRLLRHLRWYGASASQEVAAILAMGYLTFYIANAPLQVSGVIAIAVFGLFGNSAGHFELGASARERDLAVVQNCVAFSLNGIVFFFSGASAINFLVRSSETLRDNWRSFLLFPAIYMGMFAARGVCITAFNPCFRLLGAGSLPAPAVAFATWGGLRGAVSLIMAQAVVTDDEMANNNELITAQMGLWTSLFVLTTLLLNAPTIPALLSATGLTKVSPIKLGIRDKARRALLRYTQAAIQDLKDDEDEMLRGVDWGAVARYVDLAGELPQGFRRHISSTGLEQRSGGGAENGRAGLAPEEEQQRQEQQHEQQQEEGEGEGEGWCGGAPLDEELEARWSEPAKRESCALKQLAHPAPAMLQSSRKLLGASRTNLSQKWTPRAPVGPAGEGGEGSRGGYGGPGEVEGGWGMTEAGLDASDQAWAELAQPLLPLPSHAALPPAGSASLASSQGLARIGSRGFEEECPFGPAPPSSPSHARHMPAQRTKSEPSMQTVIDVESEEEREEEEEGQDIFWGEGISGARAGQGLGSPLASPAAEPPSPPFRYLGTEDSASAFATTAAPSPATTQLPGAAAAHTASPSSRATAGSAMSQQAQQAQQAQRSQAMPAHGRPPSSEQVRSPRGFAPLDLPLQSFPSAPSLDTDPSSPLGTSPFDTSPFSPSPFGASAFGPSPAAAAGGAGPLPPLSSPRGLPTATSAAATGAPASAAAAARLEGGSLAFSSSVLGLPASQQPLSPRAALVLPSSPRPSSAAPFRRDLSRVSGRASIGSGPEPLGEPSLSSLASPRAATSPAASAWAPASAASVTPAAAAAAGGARTGTPRGMHGLVRTSLLPGRADRQAVEHVSELLGASPLEDLPGGSLPSSPRGIIPTSPRAAGPGLPTSPRAAGLPNSPRAAALPTSPRSSGGDSSAWGSPPARPASAGAAAWGLGAGAALPGAGAALSPRASAQGAVVPSSPFASTSRAGGAGRSGGIMPGDATPRPASAAAAASLDKGAGAGAGRGLGSRRVSFAPQPSRLAWSALGSGRPLAGVPAAGDRGGCVGEPTGPSPTPVGLAAILGPASQGERRLPGIRIHRDGLSPGAAAEAAAEAEARGRAEAEAQGRVQATPAGPGAAEVAASGAPAALAAVESVPEGDPNPGMGASDVAAEAAAVEQQQEQERGQGASGTAEADLAGSSPFSSLHAVPPPPPQQEQQQPQPAQPADLLSTPQLPPAQPAQAWGGQEPLSSSPSTSPASPGPPAMDFSLPRMPPIHTSPVHSPPVPGPTSSGSSNSGSGGSGIDHGGGSSSSSKDDARSLQHPSFLFQQDQHRPLEQQQQTQQQRHALQPAPTAPPWASLGDEWVPLLPSSPLLIPPINGPQAATLPQDLQALQVSPLVPSLPAALGGLPSLAQELGGGQEGHTAGEQRLRMSPTLLENVRLSGEPGAWLSPRQPATSAARRDRSWSPAALTRYKPWQAETALLKKSLSSPLLGAAREGSSASQGAPASPTGGASCPPECPPPCCPPPASQWGEELTAEARARLVAGLERYFHAKRGEGLLSTEGLRILSYACDVAADRAAEPLAIWELAEQEVVGRYTVKALAWLFYNTKRCVGRLPRLLRPLLRPPLRLFASLIGTVLSRVILVACEVAVEYWMALTWSPQAQWLREAPQAGLLQAEIAGESQRVCKFIIDREIEAPERFQAIQSYRAAMAILRQQAAFVHQLYDSGVLNEPEREALQEPICVKLRQLEIQGPTWRAPSVREVLRSLPFLHSVPEHIFEVLLDRGQLLEYHQGEVIWSPDACASNGRCASGSSPARGPRLGLYIVIYGLVRSGFTDHLGVTREYFLGSGGVVGLLSALAGQPLPGSGPAVAEANALHKGPVVFHIPQALIRQLRRGAGAGDHDLQQLELDLFRVASLYTLERLKGEVVAQVAGRYQALVVARAKWQGIHRAALRETATRRAAASGRTSDRPSEQTNEDSAADLGGHLRDRVQRDLQQSLDEEGDAARLGAQGGTRLPHSSTPDYVPLTDEEVLRQLNPQRTWHKAQAFARRVVAAMRHALRDAELLSLGPGQRWDQASDAVLLHGGLLPAAAGKQQHGHGHEQGRGQGKGQGLGQQEQGQQEQGQQEQGQQEQGQGMSQAHSGSFKKPGQGLGAAPAAAAGGGGGGGGGAEVASPRVLPFLPVHLGEGLPHPLAAAALEGGSAAAGRFLAGPSCALLMVCPTPRAADSASEAGSVADGEPGSAAQRAGGGGGSSSGRGSEGTAAAQTPLRPSGPPLRRSKSRRLPLSSALSGMETLHPEQQQ